MGIAARKPAGTAIWGTSWRRCGWRRRRKASSSSLLRRHGLFGACCVVIDARAGVFTAKCLCDFGIVDPVVPTNGRGMVERAIMLSAARNARQAAGTSRRPVLSTRRRMSRLAPPSGRNHAPAAIL